MSVCQWCDQEMTRHIGCTNNERISVNGQVLPTISEPLHGKEQANCHDCSAPLGSKHHPGCDNEICPGCGGQMISCDCEHVEVVEARS